MDVAGQSGPEGERAASQKSPDAFRTISEVSSDLDVPQHVLRFWEGKFAQIRPLKRGGGRRYYRPEDVDLLRGIQHLLYGDGYTIKGVQKLLRENGVKYVVAAGRRETPGAKAAKPPVTIETPPAAAPAAVAAPATPAAATRPPAAPVVAKTPQTASSGSLGGAPHFKAVRPTPQIELELPFDVPPPPPPAPEPAKPTAEAAAEIIAEPETVQPDVDNLAEARRQEAATKLLASLKALRRDYDLRLQAAKNGR